MHDPHQPTHIPIQYDKSTNMPSDLDQLVDMGFEREKSQMALKHGGNLTNAIDWLDKNADKSLEELKEEQTGSTTDPSMPEPEAQARSYVCNDCGKKFRGMNQAQFHAEKTGHDDFAESAEELAPLTEEEKAARLAELREKLAEKRANQAAEDAKERKRNDEIKKKHTKESEDLKEELAKKEQIKEAHKKKQEKADDIAAKKRIKEKIEADKAERRRKADEEKAMRDNPSAFNPEVATAATAVPAAATPPVHGGLAASGSKMAQSRVTANHSEARLRLQTAGGNVMKNFPAETTLFEVAHALQEESGVQASTFTQNFPKKVFEVADFGMTLKEAGLVPSAALIVG